MQEHVGKCLRLGNRAVGVVSKRSRPQSMELWDLQNMVINAKDVVPLKKM